MDKFTFEFDVSGYTQVIQQMRSLATLLQGGGGGLGGILGSAMGAFGAGGGKGGAAAKTPFGLSLAGIGTLTRFVGGLSLASTALSALTAAATSAATVLISRAQLQNQLGSDVRTTSFLARLGGAGGFDPGSAAERMFEAGQTEAGRRGLHALGMGPMFEGMTPFDKGEALQKALMRLRDESDSQRLLVGRQLGISEETRATGRGVMDDNDLKRLQQMAKLEEDRYSSGQIRKAAQLNTELDLFKTSWKGFFTDIGMFFAPVAKWALKTGSFSFKGAADFIANPFVALGRSIGNAVFGGGGGKGGGGKNSSVDANTQAVQDLTMALLRGANGVYGGGARVRGSVPIGNGYGFWLTQHWRTQSIRMGAYAIGM